MPAIKSTIKKTTKKQVDVKATTKVVKSGKYYYAVGKRKTAIAKVRLYENGKGEIYVNNLELKQYSDVPLFSEKIKAPLAYTELAKKFDILVEVMGSGKSGQADAINHGISRAILEYDPSLRTELKSTGFLTRDPRKVERKKPGLKKARKYGNWSKR